MGKIEELKDYLRCIGNSVYDDEEVETIFKNIADILLNWCIIRVNTKRFRILEIEFYLMGGKHDDIITYPRTDMEGGEWFFHRSGVDICFYSHCAIIDSHFDLNKENKFGGILIRSIEEVDYQMAPIGKPIFGPWNSMDVICSKLGAFDDNRVINQIACIEETICPSSAYVVPSATKRHIPVKEDDILKKISNILSDNYKIKEILPKWKNSFVKYLDKDWRYYIHRENFWKNYNANPLYARNDHR